MSSKVEEATNSPISPLSDGFDWTWETFKQKLAVVRNLDVHWWLILLLWLQKVNIRFSITTIQV